jgi:Sec-independent protein translocase protein TatA
MSLGEWGLTLGVACVVLGPEHYQRLLRGFFKLYRIFQKIQSRGLDVLQQAEYALKLEENQKKAQHADEHYQ